MGASYQTKFLHRIDLVLHLMDSTRPASHAIDFVDGKLLQICRDKHSVVGLLFDVLPCNLASTSRTQDSHVKSLNLSSLYACNVCMNFMRF